MNEWFICQEIITRCSAIAERPRCRVRYRWKTQNKGYCAVQGHSRSSRYHRGTNRKPVCELRTDMLSYSLDNLVPFRSYRSILFKFSTLCVFEPPFGGLGTTYDVHLGLIEKRVWDLLLVLIELFSLGVTAQAIWAKINRKSAISLQRGHFDSKFQVEGVASHQSFLHV